MENIFIFYNLQLFEYYIYAKLYQKLDNLGIGGDIKLTIDNILNNVQEVSSDVSDVKKYFNSVNDSIDGVKLGLDEVSSKINILDVFHISSKIDEKLSQIFSVKSLNGSNGSKFKDGDRVTVKGYDGLWVVDGSYHMLNADNITIVVYKLSQADKLMLVPAPFVEKA